MYYYWCLFDGRKFQEEEKKKWMIFSEPAIIAFKMLPGTVARPFGAGNSTHKQGRGR